MVLPSRVRRQVNTTAQAEGTGVTGGPNAKTDAQEARYQELMKGEALLLARLASMHITVGDPRVELYAAIAPIGGPPPPPLPVPPSAPPSSELPFVLAPLPSTSTPEVPVDIQVGKKRRGDIPSAQGPTALISAPGFVSTSPFLPAPSPPPSTFPSARIPSILPSPPPSAPRKPHSLQGTFEGLGFLVNDLSLPEDEGTAAFRHPGPTMEAWWGSVPGAERQSISACLSLAPPERALQTCMDKFPQLTSLQCSWVREYTALEMKLEQKGFEVSHQLARSELKDDLLGMDLSLGCDDVGSDGSMADTWESCQDEVFKGIEMEELNPLEGFDYDNNDILTLHPHAMANNEVPLGPTPLQHTMSALSMQSPLQSRPNTFHGMASPSQPFPPLGGLSPLPHSLRAWANPPNGLHQNPSPAFANGLPAARKVSNTKAPAATQQAEAKTPREAFACAHRLELLDKDHPDHAQALLDWNRMSDHSLPQEGTQKQKTRPNFRRENYEPLRQWMLEQIPHLDKASAHDKRVLNEASGLSAPQIVRWISNNRIRRYLPNKEALDRLGNQRNNEPDPRRRAQIEQVMYSTLFEKRLDSVRTGG